MEVGSPVNSLSADGLKHQLLRGGGGGGMEVAWRAVRGLGGGGGKGSR